MPACPPVSATVSCPSARSVCASTTVEMISPQAIIRSISRGAGGTDGSTFFKVPTSVSVA
jgi:hypothetical protein